MFGYKTIFVIGKNESDNSNCMEGLYEVYNGPGIAKIPITDEYGQPITDEDGQPLPFVNTYDIGLPNPKQIRLATLPSMEMFERQKHDKIKMTYYSQSTAYIVVIDPSDRDWRTDLIYHLNQIGEGKKIYFYINRSSNIDQLGVDERDNYEADIRFLFSLAQGMEYQLFIGATPMLTNVMGTVDILDNMQMIVRDIIQRQPTPSQPSLFSRFLGEAPPLPEQPSTAINYAKCLIQLINKPRSLPSYEEATSLSLMPQTQWNGLRMPPPSYSDPSAHTHSAG